MTPLHQWLFRQHSHAKEGAGGKGDETGTPHSDCPVIADLEPSIVDRHEEAEVDADEHAQQFLQEALEAARAHHEEALGEARRLWVEEEARRISEGLDAALSQLFAKICDSVSRPMEEILEEAATARIVAEFRARLEKLANETPLVRVEASDDLAAALLRIDLPKGVEVHSSKETILRAVAGDTVIDAAAQQWAAVIRGDRA